MPPRLPKLPRLPRLSEHLPDSAPLREVLADGRSAIAEAKQEIRLVASFVTPRTKVADTVKTKVAAPEECKPCQQMKELQEVIGRRKVKKALDELKAGQGDRGLNVETLRKYVEGEDV